MAKERDDDVPEVSLLGAVWQYRWSSLALIVVAALVAGLATTYVFTTVDATARFAVTDPRSTTFLRQGISSDSSYIAYTAQRAAFAQSGGVLSKARQLLATEESVQVELEELRDSVTAKPGTSGGIVEVTATARTDRRAAQIANSVVAAYQILTEADAQREQEKLLKSVRNTRTRIQNEIKRSPPGSASAVSLAEALVQLQLKESDAAIDLAQYSSGVRFVDQANPMRITPSQLSKNVAIGIAVGILIAVVISFLRATNPIASVQRVTTGTGQRHALRRRVFLSRDAASASASEPLPLSPPTPQPSPKPEISADIYSNTDVYSTKDLLTYSASQGYSNGSSATASLDEDEAIVIVESSVNSQKGAN